MAPSSFPRAHAAVSKAHEDGVATAIVAGVWDSSAPERYLHLSRGATSLTGGLPIDAATPAGMYSSASSESERVMTGPPVAGR